MMKKIYLATLTTLFLLGGCDSNNNTETADIAMKGGLFFDGNVSGITYICDSGVTGMLEDGRYDCPEGDGSVTFKAGDEMLGVVPNGLDVTPQLLAEQNETKIVELTRQVLGSDRDRNMSNGIDVDPDVYGDELAGEDEAIEFLEKYFGFTPQSDESTVSSSSVTEQASSEASSSSEDGASSSETESSSSSTQVAPVAPPVSSVSSKAKSSNAASSSSAQSQSSAASAPMRGTTVQVETEPSNWYVRLIAEAPARKLTTSNAQLGEIDSADALQNSLRAMNPFGSSYLDIVFVDPISLGSGVYKTLYYRYGTNTKKVWRFTVKTDDPNSDIIVSWRGIYAIEPYTDDEGRTQYIETLSKSNPLLKKMQVVDEATGETLPAVADGQMPAFVINMDSKNERTFRWELLTTNSNATVPTAAPVKVKRSARRFLRESVTVKRPVFDLDHPPVFKEMR